MNLLNFATFIITAVVTGVADHRSAEAQPYPCTAGYTSPRLTWHERLQSWVAQELGAELDGEAEACLVELLDESEPSDVIDEGSPE